MSSYEQKANISDSVKRRVKRVIAEGKTPYQEYLFFESQMHGVCLSLDGDIQSCESDEAMYHEALVHPALLAHQNPQTVLIMGGGEGATAREVLAHKGVQKVVMVDIDEAFVSLCKIHINSWGATAFSDPRLEVLYMDIREYISSCREKFDLVIGDLIDVDDWDSPSAFLYEEALYSSLKPLLNAGAIVVTQGGALTTKESKNHKHIAKALRKVFSDVRSYALVIPSFYHLWGFILASDDLSLLDGDIESLFSSKEIEFKAVGTQSLAAAFSLPLSIKESIV